MLAKIAAVAQSKVALAVLGVVLVGGGGSAVAVAATTGHLSTLGVNLNSEKSDAQSTETPDSHAHTTGVEGLLVSCSATTLPASITVKDSKGASWTFAVSATTKFNGDTESESQGAAGASSAKGDNSTHAGDGSDHSGAGSATGSGASSAKGDSSTQAGDTGDNSTHTGDNSAHTAPSLATICAFAGKRDVEVQATQNGSGYDAWKVTVQGPGSVNGSSDGGSSDKGSSSMGGSSEGSSSAGDSSTKGAGSGVPTPTDH